jgi:hypothetical protein
MSTTVTVTQSQTSQPMQGSGRMRMDGSDQAFGDFRDDLTRDGFAVVKGAIAQEKALKYADAMYTWLEDL